MKYSPSTPVNNEYDLFPYNSLTDMFCDTVNRYSQNVAYTTGEHSITYQQLDEYSTLFASYLQNELGVEKGVRVALMCPNSITFVVAMWGIIRSGAIQVNVNPMYSVFELEHQLNDADVDTIVVIDAALPTIAKVGQGINIKNIVISNSADFSFNEKNDDDCAPVNASNVTSFGHALALGRSGKYTEPTMVGSDILFLQYTGGTTGLSKGAMLTHHNILANISQYEEVAEGRIEHGKERVITAIPMYHIFALTVNTLAYFKFGASNLLIPNPRDLNGLIAGWIKFNPTFFTGVNTLFNALVHSETFQQVDFSALKLSIGGGAPVQQVVGEKWYKATNVVLMEGYGLSETSPILTVNFSSANDHKPGIGLPLSHTIISLRDENDNEVKTGDVGELCAKGPQVMLGYWNNKQASVECMTADGYFKTGDLAKMDAEGNYHIVDRKKDMVLVSGFNVYPAEIEACVVSLTGVLECACFGTPDEATGEKVNLYIVKSAEDLTVDEVKLFCREKLSAYKLPKNIVFVDSLPKSTVGKILKRELIN